MKKLLGGVVLATTLTTTLPAQAILDRDKQAAVIQFADQMISLMENPAIGFSTDRTLLLKRYLDTDDPLYQRMLENYYKTDKMLSGMENYSVAVSTLSTTGATEAEVINQLADALEKFRKTVPGDIEVPGADFDSRIAAIRQQEEYLSALQIAQPIITAIGRRGQELIASYESDLTQLRDQLSRTISADYQELVEFKAVIDERRVKFLERVDTEKPNAPTTEIAAIEQLNQLSRIMTVLQPYLQLFWDTQTELNDVTNEILLNSGKLKLTFLIWVRAHAMLAAGETDVEAFDIMEYKNLLQEAAKFGKDLANN